ncbi:hypothetical protein EBB07_32060 [Paenibacillaceae bacterium]|nr:hypothetical protein EBB07_32060 [Paenibacillaceae bacterium]
MVGSIRWNVAFGLFGSVLTFLFSLGANGIAVTSLRSLYAFIALFLLMFMLRFVLRLLLGHEEEAAVEEETRGAALDLVTPEDQEDLNDLLKSQLASGSTGADVKETGFQPLAPPKLASTQGKSPEELAEAVRRLAED